MTTKRTDTRIMVEVDRARERRAAARASWPTHKFRLGEEPSDDLSDSTTAAERLAMVWQLSRDAWVMTGKPFPAYRRGQIPGRVIRPGDEQADD